MGCSFASRSAKSMSCTTCTPACVSIRQHTSAYVSIRQRVALCKVYAVHHLQTLQSQHT
jgi:hypothetical protein